MRRFYALITTFLVSTIRVRPFSQKGVSHKEEAAIGLGAMGVGAAFTTVNPPVGIAITLVGALAHIHAATRERQ